MLYLWFTYALLMIYLLHLWFTYYLLMFYLWFTYDSLMIYLCITYDLLIPLMIYFWFTYDLLMIYLWFTYDLLMIYLWLTYYLLMITYDHLLYLWFTNVVGRSRSAQPYSRAIHSELLAGGPLEGSAVDVPPSIAVTTVLLRLAGCARKVWSLIAHGERDGSIVTHRHKSQPPQDWSYGNNIQDLWLHPAFVNYFKSRIYPAMLPLHSTKHDKWYK